jgi:hypothetical protein
MFVCPLDAHWCNRVACRSGICEMTGDRPAIVCVGCGAVIERLTPLRLCVACLFVELPEAKEGL